MRNVILALLLVVLITVPALAIEPKVAYLSDITSIAWMDGEELNVALANTSGTRSVITISTDTWDSRWRPVFSDRTVTVPGRTIVIVSIKPSEPRRGESINVKISEYRRSVEVPVQTASIFGTKQYVVPANSNISFTVDLGVMFTLPRPDRLTVDSHYEVLGSRGRGPIKVESFEGGLKYVPSRNSIEYTDPSMVLSMRTPQTNGLEVITFSISKAFTSGFRRYEEEVPGPTLLVYGRNLRFTSTAVKPSDDDTRISR